MKISKLQHRARRRKSIRAKIKGTVEIPRVSVFRSNRHLFVQLIDDSTGKTILSNTIEPMPGSAGPVLGPKTKNKAKSAKTEAAALIGETIAQKAKKAGISKVVFDRGGFKYHGRVKALADGLRKGGLQF
jgi:large subunit ribosomal protein L18